MKLLKTASFFLAVATIIFSCDISENDIEPNESFLKIYDNNVFESSFIPIDIKQTPDGGYLILSARRVDDSNFAGVYLLRADEHGDFVKENELSSNLLHPVNNLMLIEGKYYFVAMSNGSLQANLVEVSPDSLDVSITALTAEYPMFASTEDNEIVLLSYNHGDKNSVLSVLNASGALSKQRNFSIGTGSDVEEPIMEHFTKTGKQLPFFTGKLKGTGNYFFNCFVNHTLSTVFTDLSDDNDDDGIIQGQQDDGGMSAGMHISGSDFAFARFNFGDNYLLPFNPNTPMISKTSSTDMGGLSYPELIPDAPVVIKEVEINSEMITLYASNTKSKQVVLLAFSQTSGELLGSKYIGYQDPYEVSGFTQTNDGGLIVTGTVYVSGRFARIFVKKLSKNELSDIIN